MTKLNNFIKATTVTSRVLFVLWLLLWIFDQFKLSAILINSVMFLIPAIFIEIIKNPEMNSKNLGWTNNRVVKTMKRLIPASITLIHWLITLTVSFIFYAIGNGYGLAFIVFGIVVLTSVFLFQVWIIEKLAQYKRERKANLETREANSPLKTALIVAVCILLPEVAMFVFIVYFIKTKHNKKQREYHTNRRLDDIANDANWLNNYQFNRNHYEAGAYYKITQTPYYMIDADIGSYGEYLIYEHLRSFEQDGAKFLFNAYIPKQNGETTEIDVLMLSRKGMFVFESKNYSGWIFGDENAQQWCQVLQQGRYDSNKNFFYNPIMQNEAHIQHLKSLINDKNLIIHSIVAFSDRCEFKDLRISNGNTPVVHRSDVPAIVNYIYETQVDKYSDEEIQAIYDQLYPYTQVDDSIKIHHNENVMRKRA